MFQNLESVEKTLEKKKLQLGVKRAFDLLVSGIALIMLSPIFLFIAILIKIDSRGPILFKQVRIKRYGEEFKILKFRTMVVDAEKLGMQITVGEDRRITKIGKILRKTKLDELPQLVNVLVGEMSFVGPRPEVPKYVNMYTKEQKEILLIKPGITDLASIEYRNESEILSKSYNPEKTYIEEIMVKKIELNREYIGKLSIFYDLSLIFKTIVKII